MSTYRRARTYELPYEKAIKNNRINEGQSYNAAYIIYSTSTGDEDLELSPVLPDELNLRHRLRKENICRFRLRKGFLRNRRCHQMHRMYAF